MYKRITALALCMALALSCITAAQADCFSVQVEVSFDQTEARAMLAMINDFRAGSETWYWNEDDSEKIYVSGLQPMVYDAQLELAAMQRAAEISLSFSHTRPDGSDCSTAVDEVGGVEWWGVGENIAAGQRSAEEAFTGWQETDQPFARQGHRRNMLAIGFNRIGIGHAVRNGVHYWVQEFAMVDEGTNPAGSACDSAQLVSVTVEEERVDSLEVLGLSVSELNLDYGEIAALPGMNAALKLENAWPASSASVTLTPAWSSDDPLCVSVSGGSATGRAVGSTTLRAALQGVSGALTVNVSYSGRLEPDLILPESLETLGAEAFYNTAAVAIALPARLQEIGENTFAACRGLQQVSFASDDVRIADSAFDGCADRLIIFCREGSTAELFAQGKGITVVRVR